MKRTGLLMLAILVGAVLPARAQSRPEYVPFGAGAVKGALYRPDAGPDGSQTANL